MRLDMHLISINPAIGERLEACLQDTDDQALSKCRRVAETSREWRRGSFAHGGACLEFVNVKAVYVD